MKATVTITFGEVCENHVGNQQIGDMAEEGFNLEDLERAKEYFEERGCECELKHLNVGLPEDIKAKDAFFLVIRDGVNALSNADRLGKSLEALKWDTKAKMRGTVKNKRARHNLCFGPKSQEPHYESGKGTIVAFKDVPLLEAARDKLPDILGEKANELFAEGNLYYDVSQCGIGFHGDGERKKVVAMRLGETMPLHYQWYLHSKPIGERMKFELKHGDMYVMSEKASGYDWKRRVVPTLRHAAGAKKYLTIKKKKEPPKTREEELMRMRVADLKDILREKKLKVSGRKAILVGRILESEKNAK